MQKIVQCVEQGLHADDLMSLQHVTIDNGMRVILQGGDAHTLRHVLNGRKTANPCIALHGVSQRPPFGHRQGIHGRQGHHDAVETEEFAERQRKNFDWHGPTAHFGRNLDGKELGRRPCQAELDARRIDKPPGIGLPTRHILS